MAQLWTTAFFTLIAIGWGLAHWADRKEPQRNYEKRRDKVSR